MTRLPRRAALALATAGLAAAGDVPAPARAQAVRERSVGDPAAPVTMIEYSSFTCPHCAAFHTETLPELKRRYIDTGKVRLVMRDFPLEPVALKAAIVAHCAGDERYYAFTNALFASQQRWARAADPVAALEQLAQTGGLARDKVRACLADKAMEDAVLRSRLDGQDQHDVASTPSFLINGQLYAGNRGIDGFAQIIDKLLAKS